LLKADWIKWILGCIENESRVRDERVVKRRKLQMVGAATCKVGTNRQIISEKIWKI